jgi:hypothetical protein
MKKALALIGQLFLFGLAFFAGPVLALFDPYHLKWFVSHPTLTSTRFFSPEGFLLMLVLYLLILVIEAMARRVRTAGMITTIAFVIVLLCGLILRWGWATHDFLA